MFDVAKIIMNEQNSIRIDAEKKIYIDPYHIEDFSDTCTLRSFFEGIYRKDSKV